MRRRRWSAGDSMLLAFIALVVIATPGTESKSVVTTLDAQWRHTSFLAETSEFVARESNSLFWRFVDQVSSGINPSDWLSRNHEREYETSVHQAVSLISAARVDLLRVSLALRVYSPRVEAFQQIAEAYPDAIRSCAAFVDVAGQPTCNPEDVQNLLNSASPTNNVDVFAVDHIYPTPGNSTQDTLPTVVLYGELGSPELAALHKVLRPLAKSGSVRYVLRHYAKDRSGPAVGLSGYGVELAIKNTEYKAVDDSNAPASKLDDLSEATDVHGLNFKVLAEQNEHLKENLKQLRIHLTELDELAPLKQWEVSDIALQAGQKIVEAGPQQAIATLIDLAQNFPIRARTLVGTRITPEFRDEVDRNQNMLKNDIQVGDGNNALYINGINVDVDSLDVFQLFDIIYSEERLASAFFEMGFRREYLAMLFNLELSDEKAGNAYALDYRDAYPLYINNLDKDKVYKEWGNSVKLLLQPYFPGMLRPIARNLFTLVVVVDPTDPKSLFLIKTAHSFYVHQVPLRIGFVFVVNDDRAAASGLNDAGVALLNLYNFAKLDRTPAKAIHLLSKCMETYGSGLTPELVHVFFKKHFPDQDVEDVFGADSDYDEGRVQGKAFVEKSSIGALPKCLVNGVVLDDESIDPDKLDESILMTVMKQTTTLQRAVMSGKLTDKENVQTWIMQQPDVLPRRNERLLNPPSGFIDVENVFPCASTNPSKFAALKAHQRTQCIIESRKYLTRTDGDQTHWLTVWLVADFDTESGRSLLREALKHLKKSNNMRLAIIQNPTDSEKSVFNSKTGTKLIHGIIRLLPNTIAKQVLTKLLQKESTVQSVLAAGSIEEVAVHGMALDGFTREMKQLSDDHIQIESKFAKKVLDFAPGQRGVVVNGQIYGPLADDENLVADDFSLIEKMAGRQGASAVGVQVDQWEIEKQGGKSSDVVLRAVSVIGRHAIRKERTWVALEGENASVVNIPAEDSKRAILDVVAIVDPLSKGAQKLAPILQLFTKIINADFKIVLNPKQKLSEMPLKRFYRYAVKEEPTFDAQGNAVSPTVTFTDLPAKQLLTLNIIAPDSWMVQPVEAEYDLDNILMATTSGDVIAKFELMHILLEGHCFDDATGSPPRGLQFVLGTHSNPVLYDTIVMANLGYFQLKAKPGAWVLQVREGRSSEIYEIKNHTNTEPSSKVQGEVNVFMDSFLGKTIRVLVSKKPGMEDQNLLSEGGQGDGEGEDGSLWSSLSNTLAGGEKYDTINIFSLASGHLYERFLRIMMVSVIKNTKHPVKFWLLNNYLSPQFRKSLPGMAEHYGFQYELVEYKWPRWLHQQSEKQRIMWGYKILFLDVLFPLGVKKIIFVDADQVVRTDMMDLMNLDLEGAPYGFTPFCDSRTSMEGFRFWKRGYWSNHLAGRRYHISALYVIDLVKFRQIAAGDRLRGQYQGLSSDPNSLSNLDQDLPNNMIHQVRIKSLPQEWLWCETWCDDSSKSKARTIDLCNNPQTKEPKLDSAVRIIPEWRSYDNEIREVLTGAKPGVVKNAAGDDTSKSETGDEHSEL